MLGTPESERLKVTALPSPKRLRAGRSKSFPPDRLSPFQKVRFFILRHNLDEERNRYGPLPQGERGDNVKINVEGDQQLV